MSDLDALIKLIPIDQVARQLGVNEAVAKVAVEAAVPTILSGLQRNVSTAEGADALDGALADKDPSILSDLSLDQIDVFDGEKILGHIFGGKQDHVSEAVGQNLSSDDILGGVLDSVLGGGGLGGVLADVLGGGEKQPALAPAPTSDPTPTQPNIGSDLVKRLMPILAPIILAYLVRQMTQKGGQVGQCGNGSILDEILGGLLRGAGQGAGQRGSGGVIGDVLGSILRGGR